MKTSQPTEDFKKIIIDSLAFNIFHSWLWCHEVYFDLSFNERRKFDNDAQPNTHVFCLQRKRLLHSFSFLKEHIEMWITIHMLCSEYSFVHIHKLINDLPSLLCIYCWKISTFYITREFGMRRQNPYNAH